MVSQRIAIREISFPPEDKLLNFEEAQAFVQIAHAKGKTVALDEGTWDLTHAGHIQHIREAHKYADLVLLRLASEEYARLFKGSGRPIELRREYVVSELESVDAVWLDDTAIPPEDLENNAIILAKINPDIITLETEDERLDLKLKSVLIAQVNFGSIIKPKTFTLPKINSTTQIINKIIDNQANNKNT